MAGGQSMINCQDPNGYTPLFAAVYQGHSVVTEKLIEARCNVDLQAKDACSPLHCAAFGGHASVTKQLIETAVP